MSTPDAVEGAVMSEHSDYSCLTAGWRWNRLEVRQCPECGTWWQATPVSLTRVGGWYRINRVQLWWARKRGRVVGGDGRP